ncbi:MAG: 4Fe-4S dicluster domain-containing protein [Actinobacteria bacterium]|jgi:ferredoxin|nr:4Fe-4S dicluster domain-containing protein [Actinomycetota bacterium]
MQQENSVEKKLKEKIREVFDGFELVIGYSQSKIPLKVNPLFIKGKEEIDGLIFNKLCINNLATYSYALSNELKGKIGIVLKPCDARSVSQLISEELLNKDRVKSIVVGCAGILDYKKIYKEIGGLKIISADIKDEQIIIDTIDESFTLEAKNFYAGKCYSCKIYDNPPYYDEFIENESKLNIEQENEYEDVEKFEKLNLEEINAFWDLQFGKCIRCYACRNICPLEICRDKCIAQLDVPHWQSQKINSAEGKFFQLIRVFHLAGRCTECGECERVCPANIQIMKLMKKVNKDVLKLFNYRPGYNLDEKPPLLTFKNVEKNIKEEELI